MMTMMMVVVVREDASIFINRRRWRLVICLTFIRIFSKDTLMMMVVIVGKRRSRLFTVDDPLVWLIHSSTAFLRMIHSTTATPIVCISGMEQVYEQHYLRLSHSCIAQPYVKSLSHKLFPYNYHEFTRTPMISHKFPHKLPSIPTTLHQSIQMTRIKWTTVQTDKNCTMRSRLECVTLKEDLLVNGRALNIRNQTISNF